MGFLKPNGPKIIYFLFLIVIAPFPYFAFSEALSQYEVKCVWGFPPIVSLIYDYLPSSLQELNIGILEISQIKTTFYWIPTYTLFIFLISCVASLIISKIRARYNIITFRGLLWRKMGEKQFDPMEKLGIQPKVEEKSKKESKKEEKPEEKKEEKPKEEPKKEPLKEEKKEEVKEMDDEKVKEMAKLIREEEGFLKEQKEKLHKYLKETNVKKLKGIGVDVEEGKILCSGCKEWKKIPKGKLTKLIEKHGFDIIWSYKCPECEKKK